MDVFCLAYIGVITVLSILGIVLIFYTIKSDRVVFKHSRSSQSQINRLKGRRWVCVRYVEEKNGKEYIVEDEIPFSMLMELILKNMNSGYGNTIHTNEN